MSRLRKQTVSLLVTPQECSAGEGELIPGSSESRTPDFCLEKLGKALHWIRSANVRTGNVDRVGTISIGVLLLHNQREKNSPLGTETRVLGS